MTDIVPFCDLTRANHALRADIDQAISRVIDRGWFLRGAETDAFEAEWAAYCGQAHCVSCNSGTDALTLAATAMQASGSMGSRQHIAIDGGRISSVWCTNRG